MDNDQKAAIIKLCKEHIDEHGSVRVGWAVEQILGTKQQNHILDKVSATIIETNEFMREPANPNFKYDWNIRKNPTHKKPKWTEQNPVKYDLIKMALTAILAIISSVIVTNKTTQSTLRQNEQELEPITTNPIHT